MNRTAVFLDKDGTLLIDLPYNVDTEKMRLAEGAGEALALFGQLDISLCVISNQSGVALGKFRMDALKNVELRLQDMARENGASFTGIYWCPHHPNGALPLYSVECECRKPKPGLLREAAHEHGFALADSWFIGDILDDVEAGNRAGCRTILIDNGNETVWRKGPHREPNVIVGNLLDAACVIKACALEPTR